MEFLLKIMERQVGRWGLIMRGVVQKNMICKKELEKKGLSRWGMICLSCR